MEKLTALLQELSACGQALQAAGEAGESDDTAAKLRAVKAVAIDPGHVAATRRVSGTAEGSSLWEQLASLQVPLADVSRCVQ